MTVRVITPPSPIVTPADIAGSHAADDASVAALIKAVTEEIDGPTGWLGRSLGPQTIELSLACWSYDGIRLPYGPIIAVEKITYRGCDEVDHEIAEGDYWRHSGHVGGWDGASLSSRPYPIKITYRAGYDGEDIADGGTGLVPERARQAIIVSVQHLKSVAVESLYLKADEVEGVGRKEYTLSEVASALVERTCNRLLAGLRIYS
jgi:hypothetical protein